MSFWIAAALLTLFATLCVLIPLIRARRDELTDAEYDKAVYHARLAEIEKDRELGRISDDAAKAAVVEEGRKLLNVSDARGEFRGRPLSSGMIRAIAIAVLLLVPALGLGTYLSIGNPQLPDQTLASRLDKLPEEQSVVELVAKAEEHLAANPDDARGWAVIAPVYSRMGRDEDAVRAWANVLRLAPQTPEIQSTLAEAIVTAADGVVTEQAARLFEGELKANPASAKARFYLAMALGQEGKHEQAVSAWDMLIDGGARGAPWLEAALDFRNRSAAQAGVEPRNLTAAELSGENPQSGPSAEDVEAASSMTSEERREMIAGMVANLDARLQEEPKDKAGWQRLVQSYIVLGDRPKALAAIEAAISNNGDDEAFVTAMRELSERLQEDAGGSPDGGQAE